MKYPLSKLFFALLAATLLFGCDDDDDSSTNTNTDTGKHRIVLTTTVENSSYVGTLKDLSVGSVTAANFWEHVNKACPFIYNDMVFVTEHYYGDNVYKYIRTDDGDLELAGKMTLPEDAGGYSIVFQSETKAYLNLQYDGKIYIFNPTTLGKTGEIDLTDYNIEDGSPDPQNMVLRSSDNRLFVALSHNEGADFYNALDSGYVAVIDAEADTVEKVIVDPRVSSFDGQYGGGAFTDENGHIYFYSSASFGYGNNDGFLRIKDGETEFDPDFYFSPRSTPVADVEGSYGLYGMAWQYAEDGKAFTVMYFPGLVGDDFSFETSKVAQPVMYNLEEGTGTKIDLNPGTVFSSVGIAKFDNKIVFGMSTVQGDALYTYDLETKEVSENPVVFTEGKPQFLRVFED